MITRLHHVLSSSEIAASYLTTSPSVYIRSFLGVKRRLLRRPCPQQKAQCNGLSVRPSVFFLSAPSFSKVNAVMNNCVGPAYSRTKIYALRMTRGSSVYRNMCAVRNGPQQQTRRPPLLLSIDGTDRQTDTRSLTAYYADRVIISLAVPSGVTSHWQPRQCRGPRGPKR